MASAADQSTLLSALSRGSNAWLAALLAKLSDGVIVYDANDGIVLMNAAAVRALGFRSEAEARAALAQVSEPPASNKTPALSIIDAGGKVAPLARSPFGYVFRREPFTPQTVTILNAAGGRWTGRMSGESLAMDDDDHPNLYVLTLQSLHDNGRMALVYESARLMLTADNPLALLDHVYSRLADLLQLEFYFHFEKIGENALHLITHGGISSETAQSVEFASFGDIVCGTVAARREPLVLEDVLARDDAMTEPARRLGISAYACFPLFAKGEVTGTLAFATARQRQFTAEDIALIRAISDHVAVAIERQRSKAEIEDRDERLRAALDAGGMGTFSWDLSTDTVTADDALFRMLGVAPGTLRESKQFWQAVHPDDVPRLERLLEEQLQTPSGGYFDAEYRVVRPDGSIRWLAGHTRITRDASHRPICVSGLNRDITARKVAEEEQRLAYVAGQVGTFQWDVATDRIVYDDQVAAIYGIEPKRSTTYAHWLKRVHREDQAKVHESIHATSERRERSSQQEFRIVRPGGEVRWIESRLSITYHADGSSRSCYGVNVDITLRRQAEHALRESEARFRRLSESGIIGIAFFDIHGVIQAANDRMLAMVGYSREELSGGVIRWDTLTPPEWMPRTRAAIEEFRQTGRIAPYEKQYFRRDGSRFWGLFGGARLGESEGGIAFVLDISDRKRAEEELQRSENRFRHAFEHAPIGMVLTDVEGRYLYVNSAYCAIVGYTADELLKPDMNFRRLTHVDDLAENEAAFRRLLAGEIPAFFVEKRYLRKDGFTVWVRISATAHRDAEGNVGQILGLVEDITHRKLAEQALRDADRRKDDFLAALGHELRNPLAPIRNAMQVLRLQGGSDEVRWAAEVTERQVQQMTRLVDDLLDVSRINRGKIELRQDSIDLRDVIRRSVEMATPLFERRRHQVNFGMLPKPVVVRGDTSRLTQVVANLLSNAAKFTPIGGVIEVMLDIEAEAARIRVLDSGIGIAPQELPHIFEPFRQVNAAGGQDQAGLGLGLALVQRLVQLHHGTVEAHSEGVGKGSEFRIRLPLAQEEVAQRGIPTDAPRLEAERLCIVVVDDNRDVAESLAAVLRMFGHEAHPVYTGAGALEAVEQFRPDVVFCDIGLPDLSGHQVAERVRKTHGASPRLVAMTGFARDADKAMQAGFDEWFLKPVEIAEIQSALARSRGMQSASSSAS